METITGIIEVVSQKPKNYGLKIGDQWFNGYGQCIYKKGDKVELGWEFNEEYNSNSIKTHKLLVATTIPTKEERPDFRVNVDAGNLVQRQIEFLNGCNDLSFSDKMAVIKDKVLIGPLAENFKEAISLLEEKSPQQLKVPEVKIVSAEEIPNKEEMMRKLDEMQVEGDEYKKLFAGEQ